MRHDAGDKRQGSPSDTVDSRFQQPDQPNSKRSFFAVITYNGDDGQRSAAAASMMFSLQLQEYLTWSASTGATRATVAERR